MPRTKTPHPWISDEGIKILRRAKRAILADPQSYRQDEWHCGTAMCIAGHVCFQSGRVLTSKVDGSYFVNKVHVPVFTTGRVGTLRDWEDVAVAALGSSIEHTESLFDGSPSREWPEPFGSEFENARTLKARAEVAARRIEHFIKTGE